MPATPQPTIYDIEAIPRFPFVPSLTHWLALGLAAALLLCAFLLLPKIRAKRSSSQASELALRDLRALLAGMRARSSSSLVSCRDDFSRGSLIVRRFLSVETETNRSLGSAAEMSERELRALAHSLKSSALSALIEVLLELESFKYQPEELFKSADSALISKLLNALCAYNKERLKVIQAHSSNVPAKPLKKTTG